MDLSRHRRRAHPGRDQATWDRLFADVTSEDLASKGKPFPFGPYFDDILEAYERNVEN